MAVSMKSTLNVKQALTAGIISWAAAGGAFAGDVALHSDHGLSRNEVKAEVVKARRDGTLPGSGEQIENLQGRAFSTLSRSQVHAQTRSAITTGELEGAGKGDRVRDSQWSK